MQINVADVYCSAQLNCLPLYLFTGLSFHSQWSPRTKSASALAAVGHCRPGKVTGEGSERENTDKDGTLSALDQHQQLSALCV